MQLYVDMDGVTADFDGHHEAVFGWRPDRDADNVDWKPVNHHPNFHFEIPPMADLPELWKFIAPYNPITLTGVPNSNVTVASNNKIRWSAKNLGVDHKIICCPSKEKYKHCKPGDIIIDDWNKYRHLWLAAGGIWITHTSAADTIRQLKELIAAGKLA